MIVESLSLCNPIQSSTIIKIAVSYCVPLHIHKNLIENMQLTQNDKQWLWYHAQYHTVVSQPLSIKETLNFSKSSLSLNIVSTKASENAMSSQKNSRAGGQCVAQVITHHVTRTAQDQLLVKSTTNTFTSLLTPKNQPKPKISPTIF